MRQPFAFSRPPWGSTPRREAERSMTKLNETPDLFSVLLGPSYRPEMVPIKREGLTMPSLFAGAPIDVLRAVQFVFIACLSKTDGTDTVLISNSQCNKIGRLE